ncbi:AAA family ATPase [Methylobacterium sp. NPDC080182]|uniref:helicase RepA family protein n=1 Tax=Methylobacterium sp. NPDC080182 TaxID=3390590 RepID=UPI003D05B739
MPDDIDFARLMEPVALEVLGAPRRKIHKRNELRWRKNDSLIVYLDTGTWWDFVDEIGGGVLDLLRVHGKLVNGEAFDWLRDRGHLPARDGAAGPKPCSKPVAKPAPAATPTRAAPKAAPKSKRVEGATYDYVDEQGKLLFQVVRYLPKGFSQRRPDPDPEKKGDWIWDLHGVRPVPYRLPDLLEAVSQDRVIFIPEGEKKVDKLISLGVPATCNAGGSKAWNQSLGEHLRGAHVVLLPDNDQPGRNHRDDLVAKLTGVVASIRVVDLPGLGEKGDIVNWVEEAGGTVEELWRLVEAAPLAELPADAPDGSDADPDPDDAATESPRVPLIRATPYVWIVPEVIPPREWIYGRHYIKQFVSTTIAPGGVGKSTLGIAEALAIATGRPILGIKPVERAKVWIWNGEDPIAEMQRRIAAACIHHNIRPEEIEGWLFIDSGRVSPLVIATQVRAGLTIAEPLVEDLKATIREFGISVVIIDPFISCHEVQENDNIAINAVVTAWAQIADETGCAIDLVHHSRKGNGAETTIEDGRGASALISKARAARALNAMTADEADKADIENRRLYFRTYDGKSSLAPPSDESTWFRLASIDLRNGTPQRPSDNVGAVETWKWPDAFEGVSVQDLVAIQHRINNGRFRESAQSPDWVGNVVAETLRLDTDRKADLAKVKVLLKTWIKNKVLNVEDQLDAKGNMRPFIIVGHWAK